MDIEGANDVCEAVIEELDASIVADRTFFERLLVGFLGRGHVLLEDVPGTGKTLTARSLATALGLSFSRIQFTPDLLPTDVTGTHVYNEGTGEFEFSAGPIFANVVLADEINRAPPKTQSALLEAMEEGQVTVDGETRQLPQPFFVLATQNPVDMEGTFELPEAQVDRFLVKTDIGYPDEDGEIELLRRRRARTQPSPSVERVLEEGAASGLRDVPETVTVDDDLLAYQAAIARESREHGRVDVGISPRGTQRLFEAARAMAVLRGRGFVAPADVTAVLEPVVAHRLVLTPDARVEEVDPASIVAEIRESVPVPTV